MCGIPASGKTTLARAILTALVGTVRAEIVSTDDIRDKRYYEDFRPEREHAVRADALRRTEHLLQRGLSVIHDDTNYYASMRHELFSLANQQDALFAVVYVSTPLETAMRWNEKRHGPVPLEVLQRIAERIDPPGERYGWDRPIAVVDMSWVDPEEAARDIVARLCRMERIPVRAGKSDTASEQRAVSLDTLTRRAVARYLAANPDLRGSPAVSRIRREVLRTAIRNGLDEEATLMLLNEKLSAA
ncbi:MAG: hypothetical protein DRO73_08140 [Candidatus Thorarchaeota archaeon]|nr:MAG: hypothetical protein DRO73_08140 [Candidatus Thorarchaeota archaeon]